MTLTKTAATLSLLLTVTSLAEAPADLRLQWMTLPATPLRGAAGETVEIRYSLRNVGGTAAFAAIVKAQTSLGALGQPVRVQPGPGAGASVDRKLSVALANGMRELCLDALLQQKSETDPPDPNLKDNRICRTVEIVTPPTARASEPELIP
jgi:hypothetical protein